jgi:curli biogenesis system outer membrane secretion channel CsgG
VESAAVPVHKAENVRKFLSMEILTTPFPMQYNVPVSMGILPEGEQDNNPFAEKIPGYKKLRRKEQMGKNIFIASLLLIAFMVLCINAIQAEEPRRIAVFPIKTASNVYNWWGGGFDPGTAITDILITKLVGSNRYQVFNSNDLDKIMQEHNLGISGEVTPETAAEIGRLIGVEYIMTGSVTEFIESDTGGGSGFSVGYFGVSGSTKGNKKCRVSVVTYLTNVNTGMISAGIEGKQEIPVSSGGGSFYVLGTGGGSERGETTESGLGKGLGQVADEIVKKMEKVSFKEYAVKPRIEGYVMEIDGDQVYISVGKKNGVVPRMKFSVTRKKDIKDPRTGEIKFINKPVGDLEVISTDEDMSTCTFSGSSDIQKNDSIIQK